MSILTRKQKYLKQKYFKVSSRNPFQYCPISDERLRLAPMTLERVIDTIIKILEQEEWDGVTWVKTT